MANCNRQQLNITCGTDVVLHDRLIFDGETFDPNLSVGIAANLVSSMGKRTALDVQVVDDELLISVPWIEGTLPGYYGLEVTGSCNSKKWSTYADSLIRYTKATVPGQSEVTIESDSYDITQEVGYCYSNSPVTFAEVTVDDGYGTPSVDVTYEQRVLSMDFHNLKGNGITDINVDEQVGDEAVNTVTIKTDADQEGTEFHVRNGSRGNGIASSSESLSDQDGGINTFTITDDDGNTHEFHSKNGTKGIQGDSAVYDPSDPDAPDFVMANTTGQSTTKAMTQKAVTDELIYDFSKTVNYNDYTPVNAYIFKHPTAGVMWYAGSSTNNCYFIPVVPGSFVRLVDTGAGQYGYQWCFLSTNEWVDRGSVAMVDSGNGYNWTKNTLTFCVPQGASYLYVTYKSGGTNIRPYIYIGTTLREKISDTNERISDLSDALSDTNDIIDAAKAEYKDDKIYLTKELVNGVTVGYSTRIGNATINSTTGVITAMESSNYGVLYNEVKYNKGDIIHVEASATDDRELTLGFLATNPAGLDTLIGVQLTDIHFHNGTTHSYDILVPYDGYMLYSRYSSYLRPVFTRWTKSAVKELPTKIDAVDTSVRLARALKTETNYDVLMGGYSFNTSWVPAITSAYDIYCFYTDDNKGVYDYVLGYMGTASGRTLGFFSSHEFGTENLISSYSPGYSDVSPYFVKAAIPSGCKMVAVCVAKARANKTLAVGTSNGSTGLASAVSKKFNAMVMGDSDTFGAAQYVGGYSKINDIVNNLKYHGNTLVLLYMSDPHGNLSSFAQAAELKSNVSGIDDVLCGGDSVYDQPTDPYRFFDESLEGRGKTMLTVIGNHDAYQADVLLSQKGVYDIYFGEHTTYWEGVTFPENAASEGKCYWYKDYSSVKVRLIGLDCINWANAQGTWLTSVLASAITANLHVVICMHYRPANFVGERTCNFNTLLPLANQYATSAINTIVATAVGNGLKFVCYLAGHHHKDYFGNVSDHQNLYALGIDTPATNGISNDGNRWNYGGGELKKEHWAYELIAIDSENGIMSVTKIGNNRDKFGRPINHMTFDYLNSKLLESS